MDIVAHSVPRRVVPDCELPVVSFVVTARNDDHGGSFLRRMQIFVTALLAQAVRHGLHSELIIVEWNPPSDRPRLVEALRWPAHPGPCRVRIIEVPPHLHRRYQYSEKLGLFQMIAKNVGVRRSRGRFVLCTNIDMVFSDALIQFFASGRLDRGSMYRIDRLDVPDEVPLEGSVGEQLEYCRQHIIRVNTRWGTFAAGDFGYPSVLKRFAERRILPFVVSMPRRIIGLCRAVHRRILRFCVTLRVHIPGAGLVRFLRAAVVRPERIAPAVARVGRWFAGKMRKAVLQPGWSVRVIVGGWRRFVGLVASRARQVLCWGAWIERRVVTLGCIGISAPWVASRAMVRAIRGRFGSTEDRPSLRALLQAMQHAATRLLIRHLIPLHTNGCGDFTMLSRDQWLKLRGYPEWAMYSLHIDSVLCEAAFCSGVREVVLRGPMRAYHIDHHSGWSPEGSVALVSRLTSLGVPVLEYRRYRHYVAAMRRGDAPVIFNNGGWGLGAEALVEGDPVVRRLGSTPPARPVPEGAPV